MEFSNEATIYVADNASTDDSISFIKQNFPEIKIIQNKENFGFAKGYNFALTAVEEEIYCLLNSDVEVTKNWLNPVISLLENNSAVGIVQPKILDFKNKVKFEYAGAAGGFIDKYGYPFCRGRIFDTIEADLGQYDDDKEIFWASGACFFIRKEIYRKLGGFDDDFFAHQEEIDLCWRLKNEGKKIYYTGKSTVYHVGGGTLNKQSAQKTYLNIRNNFSMLLKNLPFPNLLWIVFLRLLLDGFAGIYLGYKNGISHFWAVIRAHFAFYAQISQTLKLRQKMQISKYYQAKWLVFKNFL